MMFFKTQIPLETDALPSQSAQKLQTACGASKDDGVDTSEGLLLFTRHLKPAGACVSSGWSLYVCRSGPITMVKQISSVGFKVLQLTD